ncbi:hypothetical protein GC197_16655 [bacterium]|nr:hypothetical protein [bacterium]
MNMLKTPRANLMLRRVPFVVALLGLLVSIGCSGPAETGGLVAGKITADGKPVTGADVRFENIDLGVGITCTLESDGTFKSATTIPEATYTISLSPSASGHQPGASGLPTLPKLPSNVPKKYSQTGTSDLKVEVKSVPVNEFELELN